MSNSHENNERYLSSTPIWRSLVHLCIPMIIGLSVMSIYNLCNAGFVGTLNSTSFLAAITYAMPLSTLLMGVGQMFGVGGGTLVTRLMGGGNRGERVHHAAALALWGSVAAGLIVAVLGLLLLSPLVRLLGTTPDAIAPTEQYVAMMLLFAPAMISGFTLEQLARAQGAASTSMTGTIISSVVNLVGDALFILVFRWGLIGAGLSMGLANVAMCTYFLLWFRKHSEVKLGISHLVFAPALIKDILSVGVSELLGTSFLMVSTLMLDWLSYDFGDDVVAGFGLALRVTQLSEMICMGIFTGVIPLFAYTFGSGNRVRLKSAIRWSATAVAAFSVVFGGVIFLFRGGVMRLFTQDAELMVIGGDILTALLVASLFNGLTGLMLAVFQSTNQGRNAAILSTLQGGLFIPVVLAMKWAFGLNGLIWSQTIAEVIAFTVGGLLYLAGRAVLLNGAARRATAAGESPAEIIETNAIGTALPSVETEE